jgi:uncharacterized protein YgiM (DUF1202 family)
MKIKFWSVYVALISTSLLAQPDTNSPAATPIETPAAAPAVTAMPEVKPAPAVEPAAKPAKKKAAPRQTAKKPTVRPSELRTTPLVAGPAVVAANRVNVRGQAGLKGEIITRMTNGEPVMVLEEIKLKHSGPEEPSVWVKIALPAKAALWAKASFIDPTTKAVIPKKLNLRGGPGENYSVLGTLQRGAVVRELVTKGQWMQIEASTNAWAFMAAQYLTQEPAALAAAGLAGTQVAATAESAAPPTSITEAPAVVEAATNAPATPETGAGTNEMAAAGTNELAAAATPEEPPPPRIVLREGIVRGATSIQSPTRFELISPDNHKLINYLYTTSPHLDLSRYKGLHIIVTGEEGLDDRWRNTPVITIHRIQVLE